MRFAPYIGAKRHPGPEGGSHVSFDLAAYRLCGAAYACSGRVDRLVVGGALTMAQRYGGRFSPDGNKTTNSARPGPLSGRRPQRGRARANLLFVAALPLIFTSFGDAPLDMALKLVAFGAMILGAWLTRSGLEAAEAFEARTIARRPAIPRKLFGAVSLGLGVALATYDGSLIGSGLYGAIAVALHLFSFGLDPMSNKVVEGVDQFQTDRVARAVDEAERHLKAMKDAIATTRDRVMIARVDTFQATAREMFRTVENDPRDLTAARKYLGVYLLGARDAALKFADLFNKTGDQGAKEDFTALLDDLEVNFTAKTQKLLSDSRTDLDIEIDVLRDRLQREGIRLN